MVSPVQGFHQVSGLSVPLAFPFEQLHHRKVAGPWHRGCKQEGTQCSYPYPQIPRESGHLEGTAMSCRL